MVTLRGRRSDPIVVSDESVEPRSRPSFWTDRKSRSSRWDTYTELGRWI